jgi:hypothetical protein
MTRISKGRVKVIRVVIGIPRILREIIEVQ